MDGRNTADWSEAKFLDEIQTKVLRVSSLLFTATSTALPWRFLFLQTHATSYSFYSSVLYTVKVKGGGKPDRKPYPLPYGLRNPHRNLKSENSQDYAQKPQRNCTLMNSSDWGRASRMDIHYALWKDLFGTVIGSKVSKLGFRKFIIVVRYRS